MILSEQLYLGGSDTWRGPSCGRGVDTGGGLQGGQCWLWWSQSVLKQTLGVAQCGGQANSRLGEESNEALSPSVCGIRKDGTNGNVI